jgi:limonene 1,2-monooxygenase
MGKRMRFGAFMGPFHARRDNPTLALHRDLELVSLLDRLGYDECWFGEHHSGGMEIIGPPEMVVCTAAERTRNIRLGTGVVSLAYHNPLMVAERINYLDHITRGRVMFGVGPGALPSDAFMMGIPIGKLRDRMDESFSALIPLLRGEEVTMQTDWFTLNQARLQMLPYSEPSVEMAVASMVSPSGATAAGRHGVGMLQFQSLGSEAFNSLASKWSICEQVAAEHGQTVDRGSWRLVIQVHIAETREQAIRDCRFGLHNWIDYYQSVAQLPIIPEGVTGDDLVETYAGMGVAVIGTPDDAIATIESLQKQTGGFGCLMLLSHEWADSQATDKSYELFARYVIPHFQRTNANREASRAWVIQNRSHLGEQTRQAMGKRFIAHAEKYGAENLDPATMAAVTAPAQPDGASPYGEAHVGEKPKDSKVA